MKVSYIAIVMLLSMSACMFDSCSNGPSKVDQRKAEIREHDSLEIVAAEQEKAVADSVIAFKEFEVEDLKKEFVFEKNTKYQTMGYYVLPPYRGNKSKYDFFPEVEESGKLLYVRIDAKRNYSFTEVDVKSGGYADALPVELSAKVRADVERCYQLARAMQELSEAKDTKAKAERKIKFYQKKKESAEK